MVSISNVDRLVLILRQKLRERSAAGARSGVAVKGGGGPAGGASGVQALLAVEAVTDQQLRRVLIQQLLSDAFGSGVLNDARFHQVVDMVVKTIEGDVELSNLINRVVADLRAAT